MRRSWALIGAILMAVGCGGGTKTPGGTDPQDAIERLDTPGKIRVAQSYYQNGRAAQALQIMEEAIEADPESAAARNYTGQLLLMMGRLEPAEAALRAALEIDPYMTDAHNNLGAVYDRMGDPNRAEREFLTVLEDRTYPTPEKAYLNLGLLYESQGRREQAIAMLRKSVEVNTTFYDGHYELAGLLEKNGELEEAAELYEVAAPKYRTSAVYHLRLGLTYFRLGEKIRAREHFSRVRDLAPGSQAAAQAADYLSMMD
jgi:type IV pilus assembly protein PilF